MAKIKVHELAKELDKQSKDILAFLQEKGIEAKAAQSSVDEEAAQMVRKAFGAVKADAVAKAEVSAKEEKREGKAQIPAKEEKTTVKALTPATEEKPAVKADAAAKTEAEKTEAEEAPKKKKKIIFVINPQNSKMPGQRQGGGQQSRQGGQQPRQQNGYNNYGNSYNNNRNQAQAPVRPIKPLTPPSPTPSVQMVPGNKQQPKRPAQTTENVQNTTVQNAAQTTREQAQTQHNAGKSNAERPARDNRYQDNRGQNSQDRNQDRSQDRSQGRYGRDNRSSGGQLQNRGGQGNGNPRGDRQSGFNRPGRPGMENGQNDRRGGNGGAGNDRGYNNNSRDGRSNGGQGNRFSDGKPSKGFASEAPGKEMEKKREEDKRRFSQEKDKRSKKDHIYEEEDVMKNKPGRFIKPEKKKEEVVEEVIKVITLPETITIKELAEKMKIQPAAIVKKLFLEGKIVTVNQEISYEDAENIAMEYEILCEKEVKVDVIEELLKEDEENEADLVERPPVICVMGHVDHGKTSLLDAIRKTNVTDREAGGITQHIGAYTVNVGDRKITFLDTPGHEAFTAMRMRGDNATDIAILVFAADDGVMPHAQAAGVEILVAVNKIDTPSPNIDRVKQELAEYELIPEDWGGSTVFAPVSAKSGEGIEQLLEMILLSADILELKANPKRRARGLVIEAELDKGRGPVATVLVQYLTLPGGDILSAGAPPG